MIKCIIITRAADGLVFCESNQGYMDEKIMNIKHKVKQYHKEVTIYKRTEDNTLKQIDNSHFAIFYKITDYIVFTAIVDKAYPIKLTSAFLDTIITSFFDQCKTILGASNYQSRLESITSQFYFIKFDRTIKQKKKQYQDPTSIKNIDRMKRQLQSIHEILKENMSLLESRNDDLMKTEERAKRINQESKRFDEGTKKVLWSYWLKKNMIWLVLGLAFFLIFFLIF